ncbi:hypothetical protein [Bacteroides xylanisolvens]|uniref:hypothetical protein n=1 Tax=Bacteroides xylanisolvens TaxID=371601 RepID=UPI001CE470BC|nr:hypothetical protein [Bacteroides xylanisolvens]
MHTDQLSTAVYRTGGIPLHAECPIKTFRNALHEQFMNKKSSTKDGSQKAYRNLISPLGNSKKHGKRHW